MKIVFKFLCVSVLALIVLAGCNSTPEPETEIRIQKEIDANHTVADVAELISFGMIPVEGFSLVGGLRGTGSSQVPAELRYYLEQYINRQMPTGRSNAAGLIESNNTAVVHVRGVIPMAASENQPFDLEVTALTGTQTTSLEGGWLYGAELRPVGEFGTTFRILAKAEGPVYLDQIDGKQDPRSGYILAGGQVMRNYDAALMLNEPDYQLAALIRDRLNSRYGHRTALATSDSNISLRIPDEYRFQKARFLYLVRFTYLVENAQLIDQRVVRHIRSLATSENKHRDEIALEAIGKSGQEKIKALLNSSNEEVQLRAARCLLNMGVDEGLKTLRTLATDSNSKYRHEAIEAIGLGANRNDATAIARRLIRDENFTIRLEAYEILRRHNDIAVTKNLVAQSFFLEQVAMTDQKGIYVSRSGVPRIVIFGGPIRVAEDIFIQSDDGNILLNSPENERLVTILRKHPRRQNVSVQLRSTLELTDIIRTLASESVRDKRDERQIGLSVSYGDLVALLDKMCKNDAIDAEFRAGPMPQIMPNIQN